MASFLVSGLVNVETCARVRGFPVPHCPVDYPFFGVGMGASGAEFNVAKAPASPGDRVALRSPADPDAAGTALPHPRLRP